MGLWKAQLQLPLVVQKAARPPHRPNPHPKNRAPSASRFNQSLISLWLYHTLDKVITRRQPRYSYDSAPLNNLGIGLGRWVTVPVVYTMTSTSTVQLVAPGDIAIYGTICALASLSRSAIKAQLLRNPVFSAYIEQEAYVRDLIQAYMSSDFKKTLEILSRYSVRFPSPPFFLSALICHDIVGIDKTLYRHTPRSSRERRHSTFEANSHRTLLPAIRNNPP